MSREAHYPQTQELDTIMKGMGFLHTANGKVTITSPDLSSQHLRILAEIGLANCFYDPENFESIMVRRRRKSSPYGIHILSKEKAYSTKNETELTPLEERAKEFPQRYLLVDREDLQHFQALAQRLPPEKLVQYLEPEASHQRERTAPTEIVFEPPTRSWFSRKRSGRYCNLVDAIAHLEGGIAEMDVRMIRGAKHQLLAFTGALGVGICNRPLGSIAGKLAYSELSVPLEIIFGPEVVLSHEHSERLEDYLGEPFRLKDGTVIQLETTILHPRRENGTAYINPQRPDESAQLLYQIASDAEPLLCDPARILIGKAFEKDPDPEHLGALNRLHMYRGRYHYAAQAFEVAKPFFETVNDPQVKSEFFNYGADTFCRLGKLEEATSLAQQARDADPDSHLPYFMLGAINQVKSDYPAAQRDLEHSLTLRSDVPIVHQFLERTKRAADLLAH